MGDEHRQTISGGKRTTLAAALAGKPKADADPAQQGAAGAPTSDGSVARKAANLTEDSAPASSKAQSSSSFLRAVQPRARYSLFQKIPAGALDGALGDGNRRGTVLGPGAAASAAAADSAGPTGRRTTLGGESYDNMYSAFLKESHTYAELVTDLKNTETSKFILLNTLKRSFIDPLVDGHGEGQGVLQHNVIAVAWAFAPVLQLCDVQKSVTSGLAKIMRTSRDSAPDVEAFTALLLEKYSGYTAYAKGFAARFCTIVRARHMFPKVDEFMRKMARKLGSKDFNILMVETLDFADELVGRLAKISKCIEREKLPVRDVLKSALKKLNSQSYAIEKERRRARDLLRLAHLQRMCGPSVQNLVEPHRRIVREGYLYLAGEHAGSGGRSRARPPSNAAVAAGSPVNDPSESSLVFRSAILCNDVLVVGDMRGERDDASFVVTSAHPLGGAEIREVVDEPCHLTIHVLEGRDMAVRDSNGFSDPYVEIRTTAGTFKTKVCPKTINPEWNETFRLEFTKSSETISFFAFDKDRFSRDDRLGDAHVRLSDLPTEAPFDQWLMLDNVEKGAIHVKLIRIPIAPSHEKPRTLHREFAITTGKTEQVIRGLSEEDAFVWRADTKQCAEEAHRLENREHAVTRLAFGTGDAAVDAEALASAPLCPVFGVPLEFIAMHMNEGEYIPLAVRLCADYIRQRGLDSEGIFRIAGSKQEVDNLCRAFDAWDLSSIPSGTDEFATADVIKLFMRDMPEPLFPSSVYTNVVQVGRALVQDKNAAGKAGAQATAPHAPPAGRAPPAEECAMPVQAETRLAALKAELKTILRSLPAMNKAIIAYVLQLCKEVASYQKVNRMSASNLALVVGPNMIRRSSGSPLDLVLDNAAIAAIVELMIESLDELQAVLNP